MSEAISVIVPTFNRRELLRKTLHCLLDQTLPPEEIIVIDDHSEDGTMDMLADDFRGTPVRPTTKNRQKHRRGPGGSRNQGFYLSTKPLVKFFDSDDLMTRTTLENQAKALVDKSIDAVYTPYMPAKEKDDGLWEQTDVILQAKPFGANDKLPKLMAKGFFFNTGSLLLRREKVEQAGDWPEQYPAYEDYCFLFKLSLTGTRFKHLDSDALLYRMHESSLTQGMNNSGNDTYKTMALSEMHDFALSRGRNDLLPFLKHQLQKSGGYTAKNGLESFYFRYLGLFERIEQKLGRMSTKTDWQPYHGPSAQNSLFENYLNNINTG